MAFAFSVTTSNMTEILLSIESIEESRKMAFALTKTDPPLGNVLAKTLDLMNTVVKDGIADPYLSFTVESVTCARQLAMERDPVKDDLLRQVVYRMSESLETMIRVLIAKNEEKTEKIIEEAAIEQHERTPSEVSEALESNANSETSNSSFATGFEPDYTVMKSEPLHPVMQEMDDVVNCEDPILQQLQPLQQGSLDLEDVPDLEIADDEIGQPSHKRARLHARSEEDCSDEGDEGRISSKVQIIQRARASSNHVCDVCGHVSRRASDHANHVATHTGIRPFACSFCPSTYIAVGKLRRHLRVKHGALSFECAICNEKFAKKQQQLDHWKSAAHKAAIAKENAKSTKRNDNKRSKMD